MISLERTAEYKVSVGTDTSELVVSGKTTERVLNDFVLSGWKD